MMKRCFFFFFFASCRTPFMAGLCIYCIAGSFIHRSAILSNCLRLWQGGRSAERFGYKITLKTANDHFLQPLIEQHDIADMAFWHPLSAISKPLREMMSVDGLFGIAGRKL